MRIEYPCYLSCYVWYYDSFALHKSLHAKCNKHSKCTLHEGFDYVNRIIHFQNAPSKTSFIAGIIDNNFSSDKPNADANFSEGHRFTFPLRNLFRILIQIQNQLPFSNRCHDMSSDSASAFVERFFFSSNINQLDSTIVCHFNENIKIWLSS